ncbi:MAG TPA: hypothetical protein VGX03_07965 [Candidatus Binatia bacterium]|jgi:hypothetical protein|nr:hypothetical protein [Candidatus Binatia bacterium]
MRKLAAAGVVFLLALSGLVLLVLLNLNTLLSRHKHFLLAEAQQRLGRDNS